MATLQKLIREACDTKVASVSFLNSYVTMRLHDCIGIMGNSAECMKVISYVVTSMAKMLDSGDMLLDEFTENISILFDFQLDTVHDDNVMYWVELNAIE